MNKMPVFALALGVMSFGMTTEAEARSKYHRDNHGHHKVIKKTIHRNYYNNGYRYGYPRYYRPSSYKNESFNLYLSPGGGIGFNYYENRSPRHPYYYF